MAVKIEAVEIGPERALELLAHNDHNRAMDFSLVKTYARQMSTPGQWRFVGDPIRVSRTGRLLDGQNRLQAIVQSGTTQTFAMMSGLDDDDQAYMDVGKKRTPGDVFTMFGVPNAPRAAAVTNMLMRYEMRNLLDTKYKITVAEQLAYYQNPANTRLIDKGTTVGDGMIKLLPISPAVVGAVHVAVSRDSDVFRVNEFFENMRLGYNLGEGDSIAALRNWLIRRKREDLRVNRNEYFYLLARTWNDWVQSIPASRVQLPKGGLQSSDQIPWLKVADAAEAEPISEDNPAVTPRGLTRKEREIRAQAS
jgi:hypothetical protein